MESKKILLSNVGPYVNLGDRAILIAIVSYLNEKISNIEIVAQGDFNELKRYNSYDANLLKDIEFCSISSHPFTKSMKKIFSSKKEAYSNLLNKSIGISANFSKGKNIFLKNNAVNFVAHLNSPLYALLKGTFHSHEISQ